MLSCISKKFNVTLPNGRNAEISTVIYGRKLHLAEEEDLWVVDDFDYDTSEIEEDETLTSQDLDFIHNFIENEVFSTPHNFDPGVVPIDQDPYDLEEVSDEFCAMQTTFNLKRIRF